MSWVQSTNDLRDFLSLVVLYAPDEFPKEDYLEEHEQLDLDTAFSEITKGLELLKSNFPESSSYERLESLLTQALSAYQAGNDVKGAHLLQEFEALAFNGR